MVPLLSGQSCRFSIADACCTAGEGKCAQTKMPKNKKRGTDSAPRADDTQARIWQATAKS